MVLWKHIQMLAFREHFTVYLSELGWGCHVHPVVPKDHLSQELPLALGKRAEHTHLWDFPSGPFFCFSRNDNSVLAKLPTVYRTPRGIRCYGNIHRAFVASDLIQKQKWFLQCCNHFAIPGKMQMLYSRYGGSKHVAQVSSWERERD